MVSPTLKQKIQIQIENADDSLLQIISSILDNYLSEPTSEYTTLNNVAEDIVAHDITGKPLTLKEYNDEIDKGIADFENGNYISHEEVLNEIKSWRNES